ncbi:hypothetical protein D6856_13990 [Butyrivibrio sp. XB500-5]|uniref:hypothetical protein n=1 Tax=Butyrivibrio sp. XB500-5 TaxID=2364880 RepID=UPI000EA93827|nr:hypothetical protein [Butyrivibrio sp. XB500-5]RKM57762.1 hypothetical protein D6856_13990 [Butyrivibrio sp. XB500-5]
MSDNGMDNYDAAAEAERRRQEEIAHLKAEKAYLEGRINALEGYKAELEGIIEATTGEVLEPEIDYDMMVVLDIAHWKGDREREGENKRYDSTDKISGHNSEIQTVIQKIEELLRKYYERLREVEARLRALGA